jgi:hypothetical protein
MKVHSYCIIGYIVWGVRVPLKDFDDKLSVLRCLSEIKSVLQTVSFPYVSVIQKSAFGRRCRERHVRTRARLQNVGQSGQ